MSIIIIVTCKFITYIISKTIDNKTKEQYANISSYNYDTETYTSLDLIYKSDSGLINNTNTRISNTQMNNSRLNRSL